MNARSYVLALYAAGIPRDLRPNELDEKAARLLKVDVRTARRYRRGETSIPGPVERVLQLSRKR